MKQTPREASAFQFWIAVFDPKGEIWSNLVILF